MAVLPLVDKNSQLLRQPTEKIDFANPQIDLVKLYVDLAETMNHHNGLGLSANQVGIPYRAFVLRASPVIGCFNPLIVDKSDEEITMEEGCLSFPKIWVKVPRAQVIKVRYTEPNGVVHTAQFQDMTARIFQHELDHLDGKKLTDYSSNLQLQIAIKKAKKYGYNYVIGDLR